MGKRTYDGSGLAHGKPREQGVEGEVEKDNEFRDLGEVRAKSVKNKDLTPIIFAVAYILLLNWKSPSEGLSIVSGKDC